MFGPPIIKFIVFLFLIFFPFKFSYAQVVWKSDGTIIGPDGEIKRKSYGLRFQEQIKKGAPVNFEVPLTFDNSNFLFVK